MPPLAHWGRRVGAYLIDFAPALVAQIPFYVGYGLFLASLAQAQAGSDLDVVTRSPGLIWMGVGAVLMLAAFGWNLYNRWLVGGRTGRSLGKRMLGLTLVGELSQQPIGPLNAFLRDLVHIVDGIAYVGYLWPLWDDKRRTFADKIMTTVVLDDRAATAAGRADV